MSGGVRGMLVLKIQGKIIIPGWGGGVRGMLVLKIQVIIIMSGGSEACLFCKYRGRLSYRGGGAGACLF